MRFSIVVPVYNVAPFLEECFDSLIKQTYRDFEVVIVNDGSTDESADICQRYVDCYPSLFRCITQANRGLFAARKAGALVAKAEYIVAVDGDDMLRKDALAQINELIERSQAQIVCFEMSRNPDYSSAIDEFNGFAIDRTIDKARMKSLICSSPIVNSICGKAVIRTLMLACYEDINNDLRLSMAEDLLLSLYLINGAESFGIISDSLYYYRENQDSITRKYRHLNTIDSDYVYSKLIAFATQWEDDDSNRYPYKKYAASTVVCVFGALAQSAVETMPQHALMSELNFIAQSDSVRLAKRYFHHSKCRYRIDKVIMGELLMGRHFLLLILVARGKASVKKLVGYIASRKVSHE